MLTNSIRVLVIEIKGIDGEGVENIRSLNVDFPLAIETNALVDFYLLKLLKAYISMEQTAHKTTGDLAQEKEKRTGKSLYLAYQCNLTQDII
jgi:hypothetical protein